MSWNGAVVVAMILDKHRKVTSSNLTGINRFVNLKIYSNKLSWAIENKSTF